MLQMYPNFSSPRGLALIINNRRFETMPERLGTDVDEANFSLLFRQLGYSPIVYRNLCSKVSKALIVHLIHRASRGV